MQLEIPRTGTRCACQESRNKNEPNSIGRGQFAGAIGADDQSPSSCEQSSYGNLRKFPTRETGRWQPVLNNPCVIFLMASLPI
jgi:hypothetical protein